MDKETNDIRHERARWPQMDSVDRKILRLLAENADRTYVQIGELVHLSAPAVHERVRKLKREGVIKKTKAILDGPSIGCSLLSFLHIEAEGPTLMQSISHFASNADIEEIHSVAGETSAVVKVRTQDSIALEKLIAEIHQIECVRDVKSYIVLSSLVERGPKPEISI